MAERDSGAADGMHVLFVCTGNTCRSPLAAALAHRFLVNRGWEAEVESAGTSAEEDSPASEPARQVAREAGLDLERHRARLLTGPMVREADLVLVMSARQLEFIRALSPEAIDRVHRLRDYATRGALPGDVTDPYGGDTERYRKTLAELRDLVEESLQRGQEEARPRRTR